jgi:hypothetical protein
MGLALLFTSTATFTILSRILDLNFHCLFFLVITMVAFFKLSCSLCFSLFFPLLRFSSPWLLFLDFWPWGGRTK